MISILHIIERLASAGPDRALLAAVTQANQLGLAQQHTICALESATAPMSLVLATGVKRAFRSNSMTIMRWPTKAVR